MPPGIISQIVRNSHVDGPGLRTVIFLKGCPLRCSWCHNPETQKREQEIYFDGRRCIDCGLCSSACPKDAILAKEDGRIDRNRCTLCMTCVDECPTNALELVGHLMTVKKALAEIKKDAVLFMESGGGVTFSGGEPLDQMEFLVELLKGCRAERISTAIDTCGAVPWKKFEEIIPCTDLFLYDIKHTSRKDMASGPVLENAGHIADSGVRLWIRVPLIPGFNAEEKEIKNIGAFIKSLRSVERVNLLPFHRFPENKYEMLGRKWDFADVKELSDDEILRFQKLLAGSSGHQIIT